MTTAEDVAWAAGLFEGEGCIYVTPPPKPGGALVVRMTDRDVLDRFAAIAGAGRVSGPIAPRKSNHKPSHEWRVSRWADVERLLQGFYPWLGQRRRQKADALLAQPVLGLSGRQSQTHCLRGHPLSGPEADVYTQVRPNGMKGRQCRVCNRLRAARYRATARMSRLERKATT